MMNPEPSERLSERGPGPWGPGCWRGMKRRKNSWISSSSSPGTCGTAALRRTDCVVLMFTTALPCSSTMREKSGRICCPACAIAAAQNAASHRAAKALSTRMCPSPGGCFSLLMRPVFDRVGDALHADRGRLAHHRDHVVRDLAGVDVDRAHAGEAGARRAALERLDEHRHRGDAVGIHHLADGLRLELALELHDLAEARQLGMQAPAGERRGRGC